MQSRMSLLDVVRQSWSWTGIDPVELLAENEFGNLIIKDAQGQYWRLCPEDSYCKVIATSREALDRLSADQAFLHDWTTRRLVDQAFLRLGVLPEGRKYCLKIPGVLGGEYGGDNLATISLEDLIRASGHIAEQIADLPDGARIKLSVVD